MSKSTTKVRRVSSRTPRLLAGILLAFAFAFSASILFSSCNVTRTITNESQYFQRGDTAVLIQTKTVETYDATKKL